VQCALPPASPTHTRPPPDRRIYVARFASGSGSRRSSIFRQGRPRGRLRRHRPTAARRWRHRPRDCDGLGPVGAGLARPVDACGPAVDVLVVGSTYSPAGHRSTPDEMATHDAVQGEYDLHWLSPLIIADQTITFSPASVCFPRGLLKKTNWSNLYEILPNGWT